MSEDKYAADSSAVGSAPSREPRKTPLPWFRYHRSDLTNRVLQELPSEAFKMAINLRCLAEHLSGVLPSTADITYSLRLKPSKAEKLMQILLASGFLRTDGDRLVLTEWHQVASDNDAEVKRNQRLKAKLSKDSPRTGLQLVHSQSQSEIENQKEMQKLALSSERRPRASAMDATREPSEHDLSAAAEFGVFEDEAFAEWDHFRNHYLANGLTKADWSAAWRSWLNKRGTFQRRG